MKALFGLASFTIFAALSIAPARAEVPPFLWGDQARQEYRESLKDNNRAELVAIRTARWGEVFATCNVNAVQLVGTGIIETVPIIGGFVDYEHPGFESLLLFEDGKKKEARPTRSDAFGNFLFGGLITGALEGISYGFDYLDGGEADRTIAAYAKTRSTAMNYFYKTGNGACRRSLDKVGILSDEIAKRGGVIAPILSAAKAKIASDADAKSVPSNAGEPNVKAYYGVARGVN